MNRLLVKPFVLALLLVCSSAMPSMTGAQDEEPIAAVRERISAEFAGRFPREWSETVSGVHTRMKTGERVLALTLDACGSRSGKGYDAPLMDFLEKEHIPATLFINARWIDANPSQFKRLAANPLFEIANHGLLHRPASVTGRSVYGIQGTGSVAEVVDEIELNARRIEQLTGKRPRYFRSGTAYYDEVAVEVSRHLGHEVIGFTVLGDAGATYRRDQVRAALIRSAPGDIAILHMNHPEGETADGVRAAVPELRRRGFRFVKLSEYELQ